MVEKRTCDYTGEEIEPGTGIMYVRTNGTVLHFVNSKAEKNYLLGREPRDLEWTAQGRREKGPAQVAEPEPVEADEEDEDVAEDEESDADEPIESDDADVETDAEEAEE